MIEVRMKNELEFLVIVSDGLSKTKHTVTIEEQYYRSLTQGRITKEELIKKSFEFLLEREPKESILSKFDLRVINRYFPEYENKIKYR